jgi:ankyrin repeat protein
MYSREPEETLKLLIAAGADLNGSTHNVHPPLTAFAYFPSTALAKILLDAKADVNARHHPFEYSPILTAVSKNVHLEMVNLLISAGADVTVRSSHNRTLLHMLVVTCLEDGWTRGSGAGTLDDENPHLAERLNKIPCDYPGVFKALVDAKADINARDDDGITLLTAAAMKKNVEAVNALLAAGVDPNDVSDEKHSALLLASTAGCLGAVTALIAAGADVNCVTSYGDTPLRAAVEGSNADVLSALIAAGADVNHVAYDCTPLDVALFSNRHDAIVTVLEEAGALTWLDLMVKTNELLSRDITNLIIYYLNEKLQYTTQTFSHPSLSTNNLTTSSNSQFQSYYPRH